MKPLYWAIVIFVAASFFRLFFLDLIEFKLDEAYMVYKMAQFYSAPHLFEFASKNSAGVHNFPLIYYAFVGIAALSREVKVMSFVIAFINVLSLVWLYFTVRKFYSNKVGVIAAFFLALSPWAILYSRKIWTLDLVVPLVIFHLYFLHKVILEKHAKSFIGLTVFTLLLFQWHAIGIFFAIATGVAVLFTRVRLSAKYIFIGLLMGLIPAIPFFIHEFSSNPICPDCQAALSYVGQEDKEFSAVFLTQPFQIINGLAVYQFLGNDAPNFGQMFWWIGIINVVFILEALLLILGVIYIFKKQTQYMFLLVFLGLIPLLYFIMRASPYDYYELTLSPIIAILCALPFSYMLEKKKWQKLALIFAAVIFISDIIFEGSFYSFLSQRENIDGVYGPIYRMTEQVFEPKLAEFRTNPNFSYIKAKAMFDYMIELNPAFKELYND